MTNPVLTPDQFTAAMKRLYDETGGDEEGFHSRADALLCEMLTELGYGEGIKIFEDADKWYA